MSYLVRDMILIADLVSSAIVGKRVEEGVNESFENQSVASSQGSCETQSNPADDVESTDGMYWRAAVNDYINSIQSWLY